MVIYKNILMKVNKIRAILYLIICAGVFFPFFSYAAFNISATPYEGGVSLRFGRVDASSLINKEVKIRVTSTEALQYQVFQRILEPFVNEKGQDLNMEAITSYTLVNSNSSGTLYQERPDILRYSDQLLYTSSSAGESDSFIVVYTIDGKKLDTPGRFMGKILYTLRPIGGGQEKNVFLDVYIDASAQFQIDTVTSDRRRNELSLSTRTQKEMQGYVKFSFKNNVGKIKVYQIIDEFPCNEYSERIDSSSLRFFTSGGKNGELFYTSPVFLERKKLLIYTSTEAEDTFFVNFLMDKERIEEQKAGVYRGKVEYLIERADYSEVFPVNLRVEVTPIFKLETIYPAEGLQFKNLLPHTPPQTKEVSIIVKTNLARPYMVIQKLESPLTSEKGVEIPSQFFTMKEEIIEGEGEVKFPEFSPVPVGEIPVFFSDERGSPARIKIIYRLKPYSEIIAGNYNTMVSFSLGER